MTALVADGIAYSRNTFLPLRGTTRMSLGSKIRFRILRPHHAVKVHRNRLDPAVRLTDDRCVLAERCAIETLREAEHVEHREGHPRSPPAPGPVLPHRQPRRSVPPARPTMVAPGCTIVFICSPGVVRRSHVHDDRRVDRARLRDRDARPFVMGGAAGCGKRVVKRPAGQTTDSCPGAGPRREPSLPWTRTV